MGDIQFNVAKAKIGYYADQVGVGNAAFVVLLLKLSGLEGDTTIADHDTVAALLAAANDECDFTNYARKTITSVTPTVNDTDNRFELDAADFSWASAGGATNNTIGALVIAFDADTTAGTDTNLIPLMKFDATGTTDGTTYTAVVNASGLFRSS